MKKIHYILFLLLLAGLSGCDFLEKNPDMRATIDTQEKVRLLLVSAYTDADASAICEFSSDNIIDNNSPDATGHVNSLTPLDKMYDEIFAWEPVVSSDQQNSPKSIWNGCYGAIAACNQALQAIEKLEAAGTNMDAEKGEALLSRAYHHFLLTTVFCKAYRTDEESKKDLGMVYMTEPETEVAPHYERESLTETYKHIEEDLEAGLKLVADNYYSVPRYHFNTKAAHAFAARFYLYKRDWKKVIEHSDYVLGTTKESAAAVMYDAKHMLDDLTDVNSEFLAWVDGSNSPANLLLYTTYSTAPYSLFGGYNRYGMNRDPRDYTIRGAGPAWSRFQGVSVWSANSEYGSFVAHWFYLFEYTDKVQGYGYVHGVTRAFTTNENLLARAEAKAQLGDLDGAISDLNVWCESYDVGSSKMTRNAAGEILDLSKIQNFYVDGASKEIVPKLNTELIDPKWTLTDDQKRVIYCCLHLRRIETIHDGLRWMDVKRYGIEITHKQGILPEKRMLWNDDRFAIQLPQEVILAGLQENPRDVVGDHVAADVSAARSNISPLELQTSTRGTVFVKIVDDDEPSDNNQQ